MFRNFKVKTLAFFALLLLGVYSLITLHISVETHNFHIQSIFASDQKVFPAETDRIKHEIVMEDREPSATKTEMLRSATSATAKTQRNYDVESNPVPTQPGCDLRKHWLFPLCESKVEWLTKYWKQKCFKDVHGVDESKCSARRYFYEIEPFCPLPPNRQKTSDRIDRVQVTIRSDIEGIMKLFQKPYFRWSRQRVSGMWESWHAAALKLKDNQQIATSKQKRVLVFMGSMSFQPFLFENAGRGGPVGELIQWTDLITSLYILGHDLHILVNKTEVKIHLQADINGCATALVPGSKDYDSIFTDINGVAIARYILGGTSAKYHCKYRVLDSFGTEAEFNFKDYKGYMPGARSDWGNLGVLLPQFMTLFPHSPDNSFLGFVMDNRMLQWNSTTKKKPTAVVYGKAGYYFKGLGRYIDIIHEYFEVHATALHTDDIPFYVKNHGVLPIERLQKLLGESKLFVGLGFPYEGPGPIEAIAAGSVVLNPKFHVPKNQLNTDFFKGKPTLRKLTSQNPYMEDFVGKPYVYTVDIGNETELREALAEIKKSKDLPPFLPKEFTNIGMLERVHAFVQHMDFCNEDAIRWPPIDKLQLSLSARNQSCKHLCHQKGLICEPTFFHEVNTQAHLEKFIKCRKIRASESLYAPSYNPTDSMCTLQAQELLYSCVAEDNHLQRICPCRDYEKEQVAICKGCL